MRLTDAERVTLAEIAHRLGRKALEDVTNVVKSETLLDWYRRLVARKFDGSKARRYLGRPRIDSDVEQLVIRMAKENAGWGYDRIVGAMATSATSYQIKRWGIFRSAMVFRLHRRDSVQQLGLLKYYHREAV